MPDTGVEREGGANRRAQGVPLRGGSGHLLRRAQQRTQAAFSQMSARPDITQIQFGVLKALAEMGPTTQRALAKFIAMEPSNIHGVLQRMEQRGLVRTDVNCHDPRRRTVQLTVAGEDALNDVVASLRSFDAHLMRNLGTAERRRLVELLRKLVGMD